ncbi:alpha/beta hydrolase [Spongiibacter sp. KMU-158]|uniref:Alpha/beta hydrolase n=1 Tax=Spongiibacter pelagi TaxID=2760804 RepID=A0A927C3I2_9GAMM|nr:alpha/beta hydrolase [Spongiibacter pelagi]MBD2858805.1 alpha/beta hydrolase [Spongiibacter pelagi]
MSADFPIRNSFTNRGLTLSYLDSAPGDTERPVVLFLHGFPDTAEMWQAQIQFMHDAGYRCLAPDTIGCGHSQIAPKLADYNARTIIEDSVALMDQLGITKADVVGHDWGAALAWLLTAWHPERVRRLVAMSVGHPSAYAKSGLEQKLAGWYIAFFTLGALAERLLLGSGRFSLRRVFGSHPEMDEVMSRVSQPGRLRAALRIYRASLVTALLKTHPRVTVPTLGIYSRGDVFLVESQMRNSEKWVDGPWRLEIVNGGHWIPLEQPDYVNAQLKEHFIDA